MRPLALAASALALAVALPLAASQARPTAAASARTILPGHWEYDYRIGPIPAGGESKCLKPADVEQFSRGICTRKYRCDYTTNVVSNGKIRLKGTWTDKKDRVAPVTADGAYTPESFKLNIHMKTINGLPLAGVMTAKRVSAECPAELTASK
ncbi:DUF3617 domain-containing protein [Caulobacter sp.]|uniref:DUF3617 domain-containing protein n=1 Tax=Caulobacter sp. TaxID=78 RepID=UPI002B46B6A1|nr:DUF3617 family protein [Caulobacter sp.]HJV42558.1 DUF3617 family protein [Caulobacter sp.]